MFMVPEKPPGKAQFALPIIWIALLALAVRALTLLRTDPVAFDSAVYFEMAQFMRDGNWPAALAYDFPPLFPALIAALQSLGMVPDAAGLCIALAANLLVLLPLVAITRAAAGDAAAGGAALLWAIHPYAIRLGVQALTDAPMAFFVAMALWAGVRALEDRSILWGMGAGAASGLAYLVRPEGIEPALALAAVNALRVGQSRVPSPQSGSFRATSPNSQFPVRRRNMGRAAAWTMAPLAGWAIVASPYIAYISAEAGSATFSKKKSPVAMAQSLGTPTSHQPPANVLPQFPVPRPPEPAASQQPEGAAGQGNPSWLRRLMHNGYIFQRPFVNGIHPLILAFGALGAWGLRSGRVVPTGGGRVRVLLGGLLGLHLAVLVGLAAAKGISYLGGHHFFLAVLYALPFAGAGLAWAVVWARDRLRAPWLPGVAIAVLLVVAIPQSLLRGPGRGTAIRPAAAWIRSQEPGRLVIVTNIGKLTYHAGAERVELLGSYAEILQRARARSAQFVAFYPDMVPERSPDFLSGINSADLELVHTFSEPTRADPGRRFEIHRLIPK